MDITTQTVDQLEEAFLEGMGADSMEVETLLGILQHVVKENPGVAKGWAELLQGALSEQENADAGFELVEIRLGMAGEDGVTNAMLLSWLQKVYRNDRLGMVWVDNIGLDGDVSIDAALGRLAILRSLSEGVLVYDKTWGLGVVKDVDSFYARVKINFTRKKRHELSFSYAAETLDILSDAHLLSIHHREPEKMAEMVKKEPAEVVKIVLRSFPRVNVVRLQEIMTEFVIPEAKWKSFWDAARKKLKSDPTVEFPAKRQDPIVVVDREKRFDSTWFSGLTACRDMARILIMLEDLRATSEDDRTDDELLAIGERLAFVVHGARGVDARLFVLALLEADTVGIDAAVVPVEDEVKALLSGGKLLTITAGLVSKDLSGCLQMFLKYDPEVILDMLLDALPQMTSTILNITMDILLKSDRADDCRRIYVTQLSGRRASVEMVYWMNRRLALVGEWGVGSLADQAAIVIDLVEVVHNGDHLKTRNMLQELFQSTDYLEKVVGSMEPIAQKDIFRRIQGSSAFSSSDEQMLLARFLNLFPHLRSVLVHEAAPKGPSLSGVTSWHRYRERQLALKHIIEVEIPQNSKAIGHARDYGDLSENAEYEAAKDEQRLLMARQSEMEADLRRVHGSDFADANPAVAGMGTIVCFTFEDGATRELCILGEWDSDESLNIISCLTEVAKRLVGKKVGDTLLLPTSSDDMKATIDSIAALTPALTEWVNS